MPMTDEERRVARNIAKEKYRRANRDKVNARRRAVYERNKNKTLDPAIEAKRKEQRKAIRNRWRLANPEKQKISNKNWCLKNPDRLKFSDVKNKLARQMGIPVNQVPFDLIETKKAINEVKRKVKEMTK
jgi:hypothetical protein